MANVTQMLDDLKVLIECESPSSDHEAVRRSADVVAALITNRIGRTPEIVTVDGATHVRLRGTDPTVLILAHHDTVWPLGTIAGGLPFIVHDGVIRGPGNFDMKLGLVQAVHALAAAPDLLESITLLVTGDEEVGSPASRALIEAESHGCRAAFVLEASGDGGALKVGRKGVSQYRVAVAGRAAHAGLEPERGINAGVALADLVLQLASLGDPRRGTTVTPTTMAAGTTSNTVPAAAHVNVDVRALTRAEQERVDADIRALRPALTTAGVQIHGGPNRPPLERSMTQDLFARACALSEALGLGALEGVEVGGGSDGNFTAGVGVPTLDGLGAVGGGAHADDEHSLVEFIEPRTELLIALIRDVIEREGAQTPGSGKTAR